MELASIFVLLSQTHTHLTVGEPYGRRFVLARFNESNIHRHMVGAQAMLSYACQLLQHGSLLMSQRWLEMRRTGRSPELLQKLQLSIIFYPAALYATPKHQPARIA